ncbi:methyltransferase [Amycolatopsis sp. La24]|uniref:methyltransferase n=1 Tax=Amycolatopsis sp. La24 TaxID=3028304 RepID=UPI0023AFBAAA|nr:methyltransferase [Amycolatopsis sp. La24]
MTSVLPWVTGGAGLVLGPLSVAVSERVTGPLPFRSARARVAAVLAISVAIGGLYCVGWLKFGATSVLVTWCWACLLGISLALADLSYRRLPFALVTTMGAGGLVTFVAAAIVRGEWSRLVLACGSAAVVFVAASAVQVLLPRHTGGGDTALYGVLALYLGWFGWAGLIRGLAVASCLTAIVGLVVAAHSRNWKTRFPAGPSLLAGALAGLLIA